MAGLGSVPQLRPEDLVGGSRSERAGAGAEAGEGEGEGGGTGYGFDVSLPGGSDALHGDADDIGVPLERSRDESRESKLARKRAAKAEKAAARERRRETKGRFAAERTHARDLAVAARAAGVVGGHVKG